MARPLIGLVVFGAYFAVAMGARVLLHVRRTGQSGILGFSGKPGSLAWWSGVAFTAAAVITPVGLLLDVLSVARTTVASPDWTLWLGLIAAAVGIIGTFAAQSNMGDSWRVGVRATERTDLVTTGMYAVVRNPIFTFLWVAMAGLALMAPSIFTLASLVTFIVAVELQVRFVEEPYLAGHHGAHYTRYRQAVGRFVPKFG